MIRALIVDDEKMTRNGLVRHIKWEQLGVDEVQTAASSNEALQMLDTLHPDLVISDIRMPLMRGDEFLRYMKANELFKSIPIVMLSSEESTTERIKLLEEGAEDYILKPFNPLELKIRIKKIID